MKILAYLNTNEGGCNFSEHFIKQWIENDKLHPKCKDIIVQTMTTEKEPIVELFVEGRSYKRMVGSEIRPDLLQELILNLP